MPARPLSPAVAPARRGWRGVALTLGLAAMLLIPSARIYRAHRAVSDVSDTMPTEFRDPVSGASFSYVEKADGFELQSTFKKNGKPLTMSFTR